jgi:hypothetical protein
MKRWILVLAILVLGATWTPDIEEVSQQVSRVRSFIHYSTTHDIDAWGVADYWQTPAQTELLRLGDCEDLDAYAQELLWQRLGIEAKLVVYRAPFGVHTCLTWGGYYFSAADSDWPFAEPSRSFPAAWSILQVLTRAEVHSRFTGGKHGSQQLRLSLLQ